MASKDQRPGGEVTIYDPGEFEGRIESSTVPVFVDSDIVGVETFRTSLQGNLVASIGPTGSNADFISGGMDLILPGSRVVILGVNAIISTVGVAPAAQIYSRVDISSLKFPSSPILHLEAACIAANETRRSSGFVMIPLDNANRFLMSADFLNLFPAGALGVISFSVAGFLK